MHVFDDPQMKLLVFTEHKDTLDYLAADGKDDRTAASAFITALADQVDGQKGAA